MTEDGANYLESIRDRNLAYEEIRTSVINYLITNDISDYSITTDLFIVAFLFEARQRNETLTEKDICILLGEDDEEFESNTYLCDTFVLDEYHADMSLTEVLDLTLSKNTQC